MTNESSRLKYEIAYDKTKQLVLCYPQWRGTRPNAHVIGEYTPENAQAELDEYQSDMGEAVRDALARVGELDVDAWEIRVTPLNGDKEFVAKEISGPLKRVPVEDQVPVTEGTTAGAAVEAERENGEPIPHASQRSKELAKEGIDQTEARMREEKPPTVAKKATKKAAKKSADK